MEAKKSAKISCKFFCEKCDYKCSKQSNFKTFSARKKQEASGNVIQIRCENCQKNT